MAGSVIDLSSPGIRIPDPIVVDTNIVVEYLLASYFVPTARSPRLNQFFGDLNRYGGTGIVTPTVFAEFVHVAIRAKYNHELRAMSTHDQRSKYGYPVRDWKDFYKQDASILRPFLPDLRTLKMLPTANSLLFIAPEDFGPIPSGRTHDDELLSLIGSYGLDSNDASILMEASQIGVSSIVTLDVDMQRAQSDFEIYTWL